MGTQPAGLRGNTQKQSMKHLLVTAGLLAGSFLYAQNAVLTKVAKVHDGKEKMLYRIDPANPSAEYLGDLEVQGFSNNDVLVFSRVYEKAKEIGANAFAYGAFETIDGSKPKFDAWNYRLKLYYVPVPNLPREDNTVYIFASPVQKQKIEFTGKKIDFEPRTFTKRSLQAGEVYTISTRNLLGSSVKLSAKEGQPVQHFQISAFSVNSNPYGSAGINLKSGDIVLLERSFADFLSVIYSQF